MYVTTLSHCNPSFRVYYTRKTLSLQAAGNYTLVRLLKEGSRTAKNEYSILDDYLIIPALEDIIGPENEEDYKFEQKLYMHHTNGYVYSDRNVLEEQALLDDLCKSIEIKPYVFMGVLYFINFFDWGIAKSICFVLATTIIIFVLLSILLSYLSYRKSREVVVENKKSFILAKYLESLIMVAIAVFICFPITIIVRFLEIQWWVLAAVLGFVLLILPLISIFVPKKKCPITLINKQFIIPYPTKSNLLIYFLRNSKYNLIFISSVIFIKKSGIVSFKI